MPRTTLALAVSFAALLFGVTAWAEKDDEGRTLHTVYPGQTVAKIAKRYNVTPDAVRRANHLRRDRIHPGQKLVIPDGKDDPDDAPRGRGNRWQDYTGSPKHRGYVVLESPTRSYKGFLLTHRGKVLPKAQEAIEHLFASWRTGVEHDIEPRLIKLVVKISDTFAGRRIRVVSGYREHSFAVESKHKVGRAFDFSIPGVPNGVVRDYLRTLPNVGVGYYPNSTHVHVDVRDEAAYWVDDAAPGEPPKYANHGKAAEEPGEASDVPTGPEASKEPEPDGTRVQ